MLYMMNSGNGKLNKKVWTPEIQIGFGQVKPILIPTVARGPCDSDAHVGREEGNRRFRAVIIPENEKQKGPTFLKRK